MAGLDKLNEQRSDALASASRAMNDVVTAKCLGDMEASVGRVKDSLDDAVKVVRILVSEGEMPA